MAGILEWTIGTLVDHILFDKTFYQNLKAKDTDWRGLTELILNQLYNLLDEYDLDIDNSLIKKLEFLIQISSYLPQGFEYLKAVCSFFE